MSWGTLGFSGGSAEPIAPAMDTTHDPVENSEKSENSENTENIILKKTHHAKAMHPTF